MEKKKLLLVCTLVTALIVGIAEAQDITTGLVAHWKLDETGDTTAYDSVGSNNGTLVGSPTWTTGAPEGLNPTGAIDFPGGTHYVNCGNDSSLDITERRSVAAWIKIDNWFGKWDSIVTKGDIEGNYDLIRAGWTNGIAFCVKGTSAVIVQGTVDVASDGEWHHAVGVYDYTSTGTDTGTISVYIDGVLDVSVQCSGGPLAINDKEVWINGLAEVGRHADCTIDDVRIYDKALSQGDIEAIMGEFAATNPNPQDGDLHVDNNTNLSWTGSSIAVSYDVYFGTSESAVASAGRLSGDINGDGPVDDPDLKAFSEQWLSEPGNPSADLDGDGNVNIIDYAIIASSWLGIPDPTFKGTQSSTIFDPCTMDVNTTYYWRIDTVNDSEPDSPWKGDVWHFTTESGSIMWEYQEWAVDNPSWIDNEYDVLATVTFTHTSSGSTHVTEMFYDGSNTWKFRFTGTKIGEWTFETTSSDPELNGLTGSVTIAPNPNPDARGFLTNQGNKYAIQVGNNGELKAFRLNVYMNGEEFNEFIHNLTSTTKINTYIADARQYGFDTIFVHVCNNWFDFGSLGWDEHSSENPDPQTFAALENLIMIARSQGVHVQLWAWGDNKYDRLWTPIGVGGINGIPDRRIQRYIAARLGPVPGWTMGYGFDLLEWTTEEQVGSWAQYIHQHFGWQHMLWGRDRYHDELDAKSYPGSSDNGQPFSYDDAVSKLNSDLSRPHLYEERFFYMRDDAWTMENTRRAIWHYTLANGMGAWWGFYYQYTGSPMPPPPYPNPEQLVTANQFWVDRFLLDMERANSLTDGYCLKTTTNDNYVFYKEDTDSVQMNLSDMGTALPAIAVDTKLDYAEINIGTLNPTSQTWTAPYVSDWAIAVGSN
jgi:Concanavalin A-like lectin/glucanases superfamily/Domain of unknown function (DUF5060)/Dockerin type I domain